MKLTKLKEDLGSRLISSTKVSQPPGLPTGVMALDEFLEGGGLPQADISLLLSRPGFGATSLCLNLLRLHSSHLGPLSSSESSPFCAWISSELQLFGQHLVQRNLDLEKILVVERPVDNASFFWIFEEILAAGVFRLVCCHLEDRALTQKQFLKIKHLARKHKVCVVFILHEAKRLSLDIFSVVLEFSFQKMTVVRAQHRPTPFLIPIAAADPNFRLGHEC